MLRNREGKSPWPKAWTTAFECTDVWALLVFSTIVLGVTIRVVFLREAHVLWIDEARLAINMAGRTFVDLANTLWFDQAAPLLFLWSSRVVTGLVGVSENSLRLVPFLSGIGTLILVATSSRRYLGKIEAWLATCMAAVSVGMIEYSHTVKQYSTDSFITCLLLLGGLATIHKGAVRGWVIFFLAGVLSILMSMPSVFVLGGIIVGGVIHADVVKAKSKVGLPLAAGIGWFLAFVVVYYMFYRPIQTNAYMQQFWADSFLLHDFGDLPVWFWHSIQELTVPWLPILPGSWWGVLHDPMIVVAGLALFLGGLIRVWRRRGIWMVSVFATPFLLLLGASATGRYPISARLILFVTPLTYMVMSAGIVGALSGLRRRGRQIAVLVVGTGLLTWSLYGPLPWRFSHLGKGLDTKQLVQRLEQASAREPLYVFARALPEWIFYSSDWESPDPSWLNNMAAISSSNGPAFGNVSNRPGGVRHEGDSLVFRRDGRLEIIGVGPGMPNPHSFALPDSGWAANEVRRLQNATQGIVWLLSMASPTSHLDSILAEIGRQGGVVLEQWSAPTSSFYTDRVLVKVSLTGRIE